MKKDPDSVIDQIERLFLYLGCANLNTSAMDGAIPLGSIVADREYVLERRATPYDSGLSPGWDCKIIFPRGESVALATGTDLHWRHVSKWLQRAGAWTRMGSKATTADYDCFSLLHYSEIDAHGRFRKFPLDNADRYSNGLKVAKIFNPHCAFAYKGEDWRPFVVNSTEAAKEADFDTLNALTIAVAATLPTYWIARVAIEEGIPSLRLLTDPTGVKELWKLRDVPAGAKRRAALLHWVADHWRQNRSDPDVENYVRKHLRGARKFTHGGLSVELSPSTTDSLVEDHARKEREEMRRTNPRRDRRQRIKRLQKAGVR